MILTDITNFKPKFEVSGCFIEVDGQILLLHRNSETEAHRTWSVPAGKHEAGESAVIAKIILNEENSEFVWVTPQEALTMNLIEDEDPCIREYFKL